MTNTANPFEMLVQDRRGFHIRSPLRVPSIGMATLWNTQSLPDPDEVGILERVPVGLEDLGVQTAVTVIVLGNLPERFAFLHLVPLCGVPRTAAGLIGGGHDSSFASRDAVRLADVLSRLAPGRPVSAALRDDRRVGRHSHIKTDERG